MERPYLWHEVCPLNMRDSIMERISAMKQAKYAPMSKDHFGEYGPGALTTFTLILGIGYYYFYTHYCFTVLVSRSNDSSC